MKKSEIKKTELFKILADKYRSEIEAYEIIDSMVQEIENGENPEELLFEEGLEPDYVFDLLNIMQ